jgi:phage terminase Nu1 subunit (DNA packaging protein)
MSNPTYPVGTIAKLLNLTERRIQQLVKENILPQPVSKKYDLIGCVRGYVKYLQDKVSGTRTDDSNLDVHKERARLIKAQADKAELEVAILQKRLIPAEEAELAFTNNVMKCRLRLLGLPTRMASDIAPLDDVTLIEEKLKNVIREALNELSKREYHSNDDEGDGEICASP